MAWPYDDRCPWGSPGSRQIYCSYYPMPYISLHHMHIFIYIYIYTYIHVICESYCMLFLLYRNHALCKTPGWWVTYRNDSMGSPAGEQPLEVGSRQGQNGNICHDIMIHGQVLQSQLPHWLKKWLTIFPMISSGYVHHIVSLFLLVGYTSILCPLHWVYCCTAFVPG